MGFFPFKTVKDILAQNYSYWFQLSEEYQFYSSKIAYVLQKNISNAYLERPRRPVRIETIQWSRNSHRKLYTSITLPSARRDSLVEYITVPFQNFFITCRSLLCKDPVTCLWPWYTASSALSFTHTQLSVLCTIINGRVSFTYSRKAFCWPYFFYLTFNLYNKTNLVSCRPSTLSIAWK